MIDEQSEALKKRLNLLISSISATDPLYFPGNICAQTLFSGLQSKCPSVFEDFFENDTAPNGKDATFKLVTALFFLPLVALKRSHLDDINDSSLSDSLDTMNLAFAVSIVSLMNCYFYSMNVEFRDDAALASEAKSFGEALLLTCRLPVKYAAVAVGLWSIDSAASRPSSVAAESDALRGVLAFCRTEFECNHQFSLNIFSSAGIFLYVIIW